MHLDIASSVGDPILISVDDKKSKDDSYTTFV